LSAPSAVRVPDFFERRRVLLWALIALLFAVGLGVRLYDLDDLPLDFHPTRQLHSALMARGMYYPERSDLPDWQRVRANLQRKLEAVIEPPIMERLAVQGYRMAGDALLWIPRLYSILFWMAGSLGVYLLVRTWEPPAAALAAMAVYLLMPYAVTASRSFQPDPLMTALVVFAWWALSRWTLKPGWRWLAAAGVLAGLAVLVKAVAVFWVAGAAAAAVLSVYGLRRVWRAPQAWVLAALIVLPYGIYHVYGVYVSGFLAGQLTQRFFPGMWLDPGFYLRWIGTVGRVVGIETAAAALLGTLLAHDRRQRALLWGIWAGYLLCGLALPHHISTHDYYHLPLVPLAAFGLAPLAGLLFSALRGRTWREGALAALVLLGVVALRAYDARTELKRSDYRPEAAFWQMLGERMGKDARVAALTPDYGARLAYWGWINAANWMTSSDFDFYGVSDRQDAVVDAFVQTAEGKDYFLVTMLDELERQPELKKILDGEYTLVESGSGYLLYDLRLPKGSAVP